VISLDSSRWGVPCSHSSWSGARDLNPGPHGPELHRSRSRFARFERFRVQNVERWRFRPDLIFLFVGSLQEKLHGEPFEKALGDLRDNANAKLPTHWSAEPKGPNTISA
jgi:hypothetical protein